MIEQRDGSRPQPVLLRNLGESDSSPVWQIVNIWQASVDFFLLIANKTIAREIAQLTHARQLRIFHDQIQYKPAGRGGGKVMVRACARSPAWCSPAPPPGSEQ